MHLLRDLLLSAACEGFPFSSVHVPEIQNNTADTISHFRWQESIQYSSIKVYFQPFAVFTLSRVFFWPRSQLLTALTGDQRDQVFQRFSSCAPSPCYRYHLVSFPPGVGSQFIWSLHVLGMLLGLLWVSLLSRIHCLQLGWLLAWHSALSCQYPDSKFDAVTILSSHFNYCLQNWGKDPICTVQAMLC